jgi:hypothetical protein
MISSPKKSASDAPQTDKPQAAPPPQPETNPAVAKPLNPTNPEPVVAPKSGDVKP